MPHKLAISTMSLGRCWAGHTLERRLDLASKYGYQGIELFHEDLLDVASRHFGSEDDDAQLSAATAIGARCRALGLDIVCLQPFMHYEGLVDREAHASRIDEFKLWMRIAVALGTDMLQVPSTFLPAHQVTDDMAVIALDLRKLADMAAAHSPPLRVVYEALAWGTRVSTWEDSWAVVQAVGRPNFGICLDTFNMAARMYADPEAASGRVPGADEAVAASVVRLLATVDVAKVFYVQVVDGERLTAPLVEGHPFYAVDQPARMSWSRNARLFYGEQARGGYLPVKELAAAIFHGLGYEGWVSLELFNRRMSEEDSTVPEELARRGAVSWKKLVRGFGLRPLRIEGDGLPREAQTPPLGTPSTMPGPEGLVH